MSKGKFFKNETEKIAAFKMLSNELFECNLFELKIIFEYYRISVEEGFFYTLPSTLKELVAGTMDEINKELPEEFKSMHFKFDVDEMRRIENEL